MFDTTKGCSVAFADLVSGDWEFDGLDRTTRVSHIRAIITLMEGIETTGWIEHTSDWDWRIAVVWGEAKLVAGSTDSSWSDTIRLDLPDDSDYNKCQYLTVAEFRDADVDLPMGETEVLIPIDQIRTITVGQA